MTTISHRVKATVAGMSAFVMVTTAGCTPEVSNTPVSAPAAAGWPTALTDFTIVWSAEPGIDLTADAAVIVVRAYLESYYAAYLADDDKYLYPGFAAAVEHNQPSSGSPPGTEGLWPRAYSAAAWRS